MASQDLNIVLKLEDMLSGQLGAAKQQMSEFAETSEAKLAGVRAAVSSLEEAFAPLLEILATVGVVFGTIEIGKSFVEAADEADKAKTRLSAFVSEPKVAFEEIEGLATKLGVKIQTVVDLYTKMRASGLAGNSKEMTTAIGMSEAVTGSPEQAQTMAVALSMIREGGRQATTAFRQLSKEGIDAMDILRKKLHMTSTDLNNIGKPGGKTGIEVYDALLEGLSEKYGKVAAKMSQTGAGLWQQLADQFKIFEEQVAESGAWDYLKQQLSSVLNWVLRLAKDGTLTQWAQGISDSIMVVIGMIKAFINILAGLYDAVMVVAHGIASAFWQLAQVVSEVLSVIVHAVSKVIGTVMSAIAGVASLVPGLHGIAEGANAVKGGMESADKAVAGFASTAGKLKSGEFTAMQESAKGLANHFYKVFHLYGTPTATPNELDTSFLDHQKAAPGDITGVDTPAKTAKSKATKDQLDKQLREMQQLMQAQTQYEEAQAKLDLDTGTITQTEYEQRLIVIRNQQISQLKNLNIDANKYHKDYIENQTKILNLEDQNAVALKKINQELQQQQQAVIDSNLALIKLATTEKDYGKETVANLQKDIALRKEKIALLQQELSTTNKNDPKYSQILNNINGLTEQNRKSQLGVLQQSGTAGQGALYGFAQFLQTEQTSFQQAAEIAQQGANNMARALGTSFFDIITGKFQNLRQVWSQFFQQMATQIAEIIAKMLIMNALKSVFGSSSGIFGMLGLANGGVVQGLQFGAFASGGIASQPTLALIGEGKNREAVVPLPNGRSIPVDMRGQQPNNNNVAIVNVLDNNVFTKWANTLAGKKVIKNIMSANQQSRGDQNGF